MFKGVELHPYLSYHSLGYALSPCLRLQITVMAPTVLSSTLTSPSIHTSWQTHGSLAHACHYTLPLSPLQCASLGFSHFTRSIPPNILSEEHCCNNTHLRLLQKVHPPPWAQGGAHLGGMLPAHVRSHWGWGSGISVTQWLQSSLNLWSVASWSLFSTGLFSLSF